MILDRRSLLMYIIARESKSAFKMKSFNEDIFYKKENIYEIISYDDEKMLEDLWIELSNSMIVESISFDTFQDNFDWIIRHYNKKYIATEYDVKQIINRIIKYLNLEGNIVVNTIKRGIVKNNYAGWINIIADEGCEINIVIYNGMNIYRLLTICFHECIHYYFHINNLNFTDKNELMTDLALIYFGLDFYAIKGYSFYDIKYKNKVLTSKKVKDGYLSPLQLEYVIKMKKNISINR
ncbi:MAG: hypothetical protein SO253_06285 [Bacilli bacterium]|nr:hypothetical protein [Bacilli bacterium]